MSLPSASVVIPTYNASPFIVETLASVFAQTRLPDEVIVVDDCSPDGTVALVESIAATAPMPVRVIRMAKNSGGPSAPMNVGVRASGTDIVVLLDQDDLMTPERIERHCEGFRRPEVGFNFGWITRTDADGTAHADAYLVEPGRVIRSAVAEASRGVWLLDSARIYADVLINGAIVGASNVAMRKSVWAAVGGFREDIVVCWDCEFFCQATRHTTFAFLDSCLARYRVHDNNLGHRGDRCAKEWTALLARNYAKPLWPLDPQALGSLLREAYFGRGYSLSTAGRPFAASKAYASAVTFGASPVTSAWGAAKGFARAAADRLLPTASRGHVATLSQRSRRVRNPLRAWTLRFLADNFSRMTLRSVLRYREFLIRDRAGKADPLGTIRLVMTRPFRGAIRFRESGSDHLTFHEILDDQVYASLLRHVPKCDYLFDLGANIGLTSCYIAGHFPGCRVFAVEPAAATYELLRENLQSVCGAAATSVQAAAWGRSAELSVLPGPNRAANMTHVAEAAEGGPAVRGMTVSEMFVLSGFPRIDVIKIDVEGAEVSILAGDLDWLRVVNHIVIEFHGDSRVQSRFDDIMAETGFRVVESDWHTVLASRVVTPSGR